MVQGIDENPSRTVVGLTGGFGSGKSTVAGIFKKLGAFVLNADELAHEVLEPGNEVYRHVAELFPEAVPEEGQPLDRKKLAEIIFTNQERRRKLESISHPYVFNRMFSEAAKADRDVVVLEVPLLYETGFDQYCGLNIVVSAEQETCVSRLLQKGFDSETISRRMDAQMPLEDKVKKADKVINNSGDLEDTGRQVQEIWNYILSASKGAL